MDDWESAADVEEEPTVNAWEGEDASEEETGGAWDDEDSEQKDTDKPRKPRVEGTAADEDARVKAKADKRRALQQKKEEEAKRKKEEEEAKKVANDPKAKMAEKARIQQLDRDRSSVLTADLFAGLESLTVKPDNDRANDAKPAFQRTPDDPTAAAEIDLFAASSTPIAPKPIGKPGVHLEEVKLVDDKDFETFGSDLVKRFQTLPQSMRTSQQMIKFLKTLINGLSDQNIIRMDELGEVKRNVTVKHNELTNRSKDKKKPAAAKTAAAGKTVAGKAATVKFSAGGAKDNFGSHYDEDGDDYDFL